MALIPGTLPTATKYPNDPQSLLDTFASYLTAPEVKKNRPTVTVVAPAGGGTVTFNTNTVDETLYVELGGAITILTVVFPSDTVSVIGQTISLISTHAINATVSYTNGTRVPTAPTALAAGVLYQWRKTKANTWVGGARSASGWAAQSGTAARTNMSLSTAGVSYTQAELTAVIQRLNGLITDLRTLGILTA
jgi:hypothetical protein